MTSSFFFQFHLQTQTVKLQVLTQGPPSSIEIFKSVDSTVVVKRNKSGDDHGNLNNIKNLNNCSSLAQINDFDENKPCWAILKG